MDEIFGNDDESVDKALQQLMLHFDAVQIFATRHETARGGQRTIGISRGKGNYFSRMGMVEHWMATGVEEEESLDEEGDDYDGGPGE